ncbi:hypothetical protein M409DRAFT_27979 [Zasmidium cellare ATCC 36951]|uniref:Uncharacterized protein n=1 Tax=Zasmidium cellare ATCC 36951 TaxID=1080233 RepID=A0A6A6C3A3_ZASCE|nr:uncharacterized protein M409DRAFT_27979 [Zasmidium cellare ATCC 36951]KAF2161584.1 hypothetical protein M409DRAFT_27979 [Zasmidium cellare ATCC 36951]
MPPTYEPIYISDSNHGEVFKDIVRTSRPITPDDLSNIRTICETLNDEDTIRIMNIERWALKYNLNMWRERASRWSDREAKYVIECLRWDYTQSEYIYQLGREHEQKLQEEALAKAAASGNASPIDDD